MTVRKLFYNDTHVCQEFTYAVNVRHIKHAFGPPYHSGVQADCSHEVDTKELSIQSVGSIYIFTLALMAAR